MANKKILEKKQTVIDEIKDKVEEKYGIELVLEQEIVK